MKAYELLYFVAPTLEEEARANVQSRIEGVITTGEGKVDNVEPWGKRKLAYPINDMTEGYYVLVEFECVPSFPAELDRHYKIDEEIMRSIIICKDDIA